MTIRIEDVNISYVSIQELIIDYSSLSCCLWSHLGLVILESVCLVHHQTSPVNRSQDSHINSDQLIRSQQHMKLHRSLFLREGISVKKMIHIAVLLNQ